MPHRPLFVLRCHHFSPVIYFIAISVSLPPSPSPSPPSLQCLSSFFTCALPSPPPPLSPCPLGRSVLLSPAPPLSTPLRTVPTNTSLETLHYTTQHNSTLLTLLETLLYVSVSVSFSTPSLSQSRLGLPLLVFSFARVTAHRRHFDDDAECKKERKSRRRRAGGTREIERDRETERNRETKPRRRERRRERGETALSTARRVRRGEQYNCI